jgi:hypothetical protein
MSGRFVVPSASLLLALAACAPELAPLGSTESGSPESSMSIEAGPDPEGSPID